jgi:hypothetical protein
VEEAKAAKPVAKNPNIGNSTDLGKKYDVNKLLSGVIISSGGNK